MEEQHVLGPDAVSLIVVGLMAASVMLFVLPKPCVCEHCAFHRHERTQAREAQRVRRHRAAHSNWGVPWGDKRCAQCALGHTDDEER